MVDSVLFRKSNAFNGAPHHCGDNQVGSSSTDKDAEVIRIELARIPSNVRSLAISITSFRGLPFTAVSKALKITDFSLQQNTLILKLLNNHLDLQGVGCFKITSLRRCMETSLNKVFVSDFYSILYRL